MFLTMTLNIPTQGVFIVGSDETSWDLNNYLFGVKILPEGCCEACENNFNL